MTDRKQIRNGSIVSDPTLPEPIKVLMTVSMGASLKFIGRGRSTGPSTMRRN